MNEQAKPYQIALFFPPSFNQETLDKTIQRVKKLITDQEGSFSGTTEPTAQLKKLSYPINKHQEAFHLNLEFSLTPEAVQSLTQKLNLENDLIRYLISVKTQVQDKPKQDIDFSKMVEKVEPLSGRTKSMPDRPQEPFSLDKKAFPGAKPDEKPAEKKEKVVIEDLDKKLEEILNQ